MYQQITIKTLKNQGKNNSEIARDIGVHRNTVIAVLKRGVVEKLTRERPSSFATYHTKIEELLKKKVTKFRIWQILKDEYHLEPSYSAFCKYTQDHIKQEKPAFLRHKS